MPFNHRITMPLTPEQELELITSTASIAKSAERIFDKIERVEEAQYRRSERLVEIVGDMARRFDASMGQLRKDVSDIRHQLYPIARDMEKVQEDVGRNLTPVHGVPIPSPPIGILTPPSGVPAYNPQPAVPASPRVESTGIDFKFHVNWKTVWAIGRWALAALGGGFGVWLAKALGLMK